VQPKVPNYPTTYTSAPVSSGADISRITHPEAEKEKDKPLVSVIVTIFSGSSYDSLFRSVPQIAPNGRVSVFHVTPRNLRALLDRMKDTNKACRDKVLSELCGEIESLSPDAVVFNWECCSEWSSNSFGQYRKVTMDLMRLALERKHMVMASDFALKALISDWSEPDLGPNPFVKIGEFSSSFELGFLPEALKGCASAQLQKVGELCDNGKATVHALGGTIGFTVVQDVKSSKYEVEVMTVATRLGTLPLDLIPKHTCSLGDHRGAAGHVMLHYATGGKLLVSAGHWIELSRLDVSAESLLKVAETNYGSECSAQISSDLKAASSEVEREQVVQRYACQFVQQSAPCQYMGYQG